MQRPYHSFLDHNGVLAFAHRGGMSHASENTLEAFAHAVALGYRYLETDVHVSSDNVLYAFHDDDLARMVGRAVKIEQLSAADIDSIRIDGSYAIPRMMTLFEAFPNARFNIDAKTWRAVEPLCALIETMATHERICIGCFEDARLRAIIRQLSKPVCHSVGMFNAARFRLGAFVRLPQMFAASCVQLPIYYGRVKLVTPASVAYAHRLGLQIHVWTVNDAATMNNLLDIGVDGIMTDDCQCLKDVLQARGLWNA